MRLVFLDVDDTLITPPYAAVKRVGEWFGKRFPPESEFLNRKSIQFYDAFPDLFRSAHEMWGIALLSLPFGYFKAQRALPLDMPRMHLWLGDHRVYLVSKNPPSFTRWRLRRLRDIFGVGIGDRYIACGPIFGRSPSKVEIIRQIAADRGVALADCLLIDDSAENVREATETGIGGVLVAATWNTTEREELAAMSPPGPVVSTSDIASTIATHLNDAVEPDQARNYLVPPLTLATVLRLAATFVRRKVIYDAPLPGPANIFPVARNPWLSLLYRDPQAAITARIAKVQQSSATSFGTRLIALAKGSTPLLLPAGLIGPRALRKTCKTLLEKRGHRLVADALFFFTSVSRESEIERILTSTRLNEAIQSYATSHDVPVKDAEGMARRYAGEITAGRTYLGCSLAQYILEAVLKRTFSRVDVRTNPAVQHLEDDHFLVYASIHRSYLDSGVLYAVLAKHTMTFPFIVAADKMRRVWIGRLGLIAGALFLRRKFVDVMYAAILSEHIGMMQSGGNSIEVFLEGQRSRSGLTLPPKKGIASIVWQNMVDASRQQYPVAIVPVSFAYNKLPESEMLIEESHDERKKAGGISLRETADMRVKRARKKSFITRLRAASRRLRNRPVSECYVTFGNPIVLKTAAPQDPVPVNGLLQQYLDQTMSAINAVTPVLPSSILCLGLLSAKDCHLIREDACKFLELAKAIIAIYDLPLKQEALSLLSTERQIDDFLKLPFVNRKFKRHRINESSILSFSDLDIERAAYYKNNVLHFFVLPALLSSVLRTSRVGRVEEIHRFLDHMFNKLAKKYFLPPTYESHAFVDVLLHTFEGRQLLMVKDGSYVVNLEGSDFAALALMAEVGDALVQEDLSEIFENFRRAAQRISVDLRLQISQVATETPQPAQVANVSETGFFLTCDGALQEGDKVHFCSTTQPATELRGTVMRVDVDGVGVKIDMVHKEPLASPQQGVRSIDRRGSRVDLTMPGSFTWQRSMDVVGRITSLSPSGALIAAELPFKEGDAISGAVHHDGTILDVEGRVMRTSQMGFGLRFKNLTLDKEAKLLLLIASFVQSGPAMEQAPLRAVRQRSGK